MKTKTAEEILIEFGFTNNRGYLEYDGIIHVSDIVECMEAYHQQFMVTDEEIEKMAYSQVLYDRQSFIEISKLIINKIFKNI